MTKHLPLLLWLIAFPLEAAACWLLISDPSLPVLLAAVGIHILAAVLFGASLLRRTDGEWPLAWPLLGGTIALLAFPLLGMVAVAVVYVLANLVGWRVGGTARLQYAIETDNTAQNAVERASELEVALLDELEIEPIVDVLRENDPELKRAAIEAISRQGGSDAVRLLIGLLHDPSPDARFFASIALSRLEDEISRSILAAQQTVAENPRSTVAREQLGQLYLDYAVSGFLEGVTRDYYFDLARRTFEDVLPASERADDVMLRLSRLYLLQGDIGETAALLDDLSRRHPRDMDLHLMRMDAIYQFGDLRELIRYAERVAPSLGDDPLAREVVEWWAFGTREEAALAG